MNPEPFFPTLALIFAGEADNAGGETVGSGGFFDMLFGGPYGFLVMLLLMFMVLYLFMIRPESKRQKSREAMLKSLKKGDTVVTSSGIIGKIHRVEEREVLLQVDNDSKVKMRMLKSAVGEVLPGGKVPEKVARSAPGPQGRG